MCRLGKPEVAAVSPADNEYATTQLRITVVRGHKDSVGDPIARGGELLKHPVQLRLVRGVGQPLNVFENERSGLSFRDNASVFVEKGRVRIGTAAFLLQPEAGLREWRAWGATDHYLRLTLGQPRPIHQLVRGQFPNVPAYRGNSWKIGAE